MLKKYALMVLMIPMLTVGCSKKEEKKEYIIGKDVSMFMDITEGMGYEDVYEIMEEAEKNGFGKMKDSYSGSLREGDKGDLRFDFDIVDERAKAEFEMEEYHYKVSGKEQQMYLEGHPVFESSYNGATVSVEYVIEGYEKIIKKVMYNAEDGEEKLSFIVYDFEKGYVTDEFGVAFEYSAWIEALKEGCSKKEVDELIVELTNEKANEEILKKLKENEDEIWEREIGF